MLKMVNKSKDWSKTSLMKLYDGPSQDPAMGTSLEEQPELEAA